MPSFGRRRCAFFYLILGNRIERHGVLRPLWSIHYKCSCPYASSTAQYRTLCSPLLGFWLRYFLLFVLLCVFRLSSPAVGFTSTSCASSSKATHILLQISLIALSSISLPLSLFLLDLLPLACCVLSFSTLKKSMCRLSWLQFDVFLCNNQLVCCL